MLLQNAAIKNLPDAASLCCGDNATMIMLLLKQCPCNGTWNKQTELHTLQSYFKTEHYCDNTLKIDKIKFTVWSTGL